MSLTFDAPTVARLEHSYRAPAIAAQRARTRAALGARPGEAGLDVGCGPGYLACELAREVSPTGRMVAIDSSPDMLASARARIAAAGLADVVEVRAGDATRLDFERGRFDFVVAVQVYLYVADVAGALAQAARVLRPGGRLLVVDTDWDSCVWLTADPARHRRILEVQAEHYTSPHLPPRLPGLLRDAGLRLRVAEAIPVVELAPSEDSYSRSLAGMMADLASRRGIPRAEAEAWKADLLARTGAGDYFFSVNRYLFLADRPAGP